MGGFRSILFLVWLMFSFMLVLAAYLKSITLLFIQVHISCICTYMYIYVHVHVV